MSDHEINEAIAKWCVAQRIIYAIAREVPDYLTDVEMLDEAIRYEDKEIRVKFYKEVFKMLTIKQRAEAFLRALGKWKEGE
jgi:hypothetical protein